MHSAGKREDRIDQSYAHFHRVLGGLLEELAALPGVVWLTEQQHVLRGEGRRNDYAWAIYRVPDLEPYRARLAELERVQQKAVTEMGLGRMPRELLLPQVIEDVTHVRLGEKGGYRSSPKPKKAVLAIFETALNTTKKNLREFQRYGGGDDGVRRLEVEIRDLEAVRQTVLSAPEQPYRVRVWQPRRFYPYIYQENMKTKQVRCRNHGLILVGQSIGLSQPREVRKVRSDKRTLEPLFAFGKTQVYFERDWQAAGAKG